MARLFLLFLMLLHMALPAQANLIRDAEIEGFLRQLARPIFKAAGINVQSVKVYVIADDRINAFVAGGQRIFVHTGLLTKTQNPNEVLGVLAHESGHIAGGHLAQLSSELERASAQRIIGMLVGTAAVIGGAASGNKSAGKVGQGVFMGSQGLAQRGLLSYQRSMEASADQAALRYLNSTKQSAYGMLTLFRKLARDNLAALDKADPYLFSHPMPFDRVRSLEQGAKASPYFNKADEPGMVLRHDLIKAKLDGFMLSPTKVMQRYPPSIKTMPARYARAIALFRKGDIRGAIPMINSLTDDLPENPYFWELKAQAYLENARPKEGLPAILRARELLPNNGLLQHIHAQLLLAQDNKSGARDALPLLREAISSEGGAPTFYKDMARAYGILGDVPRAELATAEFAYAAGDKRLAKQKAQTALKLFKSGSPEWTKANDIMGFVTKK